MNETLIKEYVNSRTMFDVISVDVRRGRPIDFVVTIKYNLDVFTMNLIIDLEGNIKEPSIIVDKAFKEYLIHRINSFRSEHKAIYDNSTKVISLINIKNV